jgi:hypothetical protein
MGEPRYSAPYVYRSPITGQSWVLRGGGEIRFEGRLFVQEISEKPQVAQEGEG